ncbi:hypothetical protein HWV62_6527 [Athelia sp. TMB]|nr:hypothetical protein HWV62_6527 [Athelia sp. TMB]
MVHHVAEVAAQGQIMQWIAALQNHPHISQMQDRQSLSSQPFVLPANVKTVPSGSSHQPTTFTPTDDSILARALYDCQGSGISYKQAIEGLHLVKGHSMSQWKDYFLDHRPRINQLIARIANPTVTSSNGLLSSQFQQSRREQAARVSTMPFPRRAHRRRQPTQKAQAALVKPKAPSARLTINSLTAFDTPASSRDFAPEPPSQEPSPPTQIVATMRGNAFTPADTQFMIKYISWELSRDCNLNKTKLCGMLETKAPHHPAASWRQHMRSSENIIDRIMDTAYEDEEASSSSGSHQSSEYELVSGETQKSENAAADDSEAQDSEDSAEDEQNMGPIRVYTAADRRLLAKYIATVEDWELKNDLERFTPFYERMGSLVRKYKQRLVLESAQPPLAAAPVRQSETSSSETLPPALKRKHRGGEGEGVPAVKRLRDADVVQDHLPYGDSDSNCHTSE